MESRRLARERKTIKAMLAMFCAGAHETSGAICPECVELYAYAMLKLDKCAFKDAKPACAKCPIHCYKPEMREKIRQVMRYSGPRMLRKHPILSISHIINSKMAVNPQIKKQKKEA